MDLPHIPLIGGAYGGYLVPDKDIRIGEEDRIEIVSAGPSAFYLVGFNGKAVLTKAYGKVYGNYHKVDARELKR